MPAGLINPIPAARRAQESEELGLAPAVSRELDIRSRLAVFLPLDPAAGAALLDYADFVLDQEAKYCQQ